MSRELLVSHPIWLVDAEGSISERNKEAAFLLFLLAYANFLSAYDLLCVSTCRLTCITLVLLIWTKNVAFGDLALGRERYCGNSNTSALRAISKSFANHSVCSSVRAHPCGFVAYHRNVTFPFPAAPSLQAWGHRKSCRMIDDCKSAEPRGYPVQNIIDISIGRSEMLSVFNWNIYVMFTLQGVAPATSSIACRRWINIFTCLLCFLMFFNLYLLVIVRAQNAHWSSF